MTNKSKFIAYYIYNTSLFSCQEYFTTLMHYVRTAAIQSKVGTANISSTTEIWTLNLEYLSKH